MANPVITLILDAKNLASPQLKALQKDLKKAETGTDKMNAAMGRAGMVAKGALVAGFAAAGYAAVRFVDDAVRGAIEEEASLARLGAALRANVQDWDGNTEAIERGIAARVGLGFEDDDLRDSMAMLVTMTRDVETAQRAQAAAMDLARYKGIALADASGAVGKAMQGNKRVLKDLGIATSDAGTAMETLSEIEKAVSGQAAEYAETTAGRIDAARARIKGWQDELGASVVKGADDIGTALDFIAYTLTHLEPNQDLEATFNDWAAGLADAERAAKSTAAVMRGDLYTATTLGADSIGELNRMYGSGRTAAKTYADAIGDSNRRVRVSYSRTADYLLGEYSADFDRAMGIQEARADLHAAKADEDRARAYERLAELGALTEKDYQKWGAALERLANKTKGETHKAIDAAIEEFKRLRALAGKPYTVSVTYVGKTGNAANYEHNASGGWVGMNGPEVVRVGEAGPEYVVPNHQLQAPIGGAGGGHVTLVINSAWPPSPSQVREFADVVDAEFAQRRVRWSPA